jgi:hypothetical protein
MTSLRSVSFFLSLGLGTSPPTPLPAGEFFPPPLVPGGGTQLACGREGGGVPIRTRVQTLWYFSFYVLCGFGHVRKRPNLICGSVAWVHSLMGCLFPEQFIYH